MGDLKDPRLMALKAILFLVAGSLAGLGLLWERWSGQDLFLLAVVIVSFSRAYYFCFYVIEHYIDGNYRYAGLSSLLRYWWLQRRTTRKPGSEGDFEKNAVSRKVLPTSDEE